MNSRQATTVYINKISFPLILSMAFFVFMTLTFPGQSFAGDDNIAACAKMENDAERLHCYDQIAGRKASSLENIAATGSETVNKKQQLSGNDNLSVMEKHWDLDLERRKHTFAISPYRPTYILPVAYNSSPNQNELLDVDPKGRAQNNEAKFQISFKMKLWEDVLDKDIDVWLAYTQLAFWQLYNTPFSSPFRETNYEPELLVNFRTDYEFFGFKGRILTLGLNHQSNGRSRPLSRSWNRATANVGLEKNKFNLFLKTWYRIPESEDNDDNPDLSRYMGYGELSAVYYWNKHKFAATLRNNLRSENIGAVQLDWSFPLPFLKSDRFSGYIQYFNGYGESLLDYYTSINRISVGFMLKDW
jgi:phospholipase A1